MEKKVLTENGNKSIFLSDVSLDEDRQITIDNIQKDIERMHSLLMSMENLTPEGEIIRDDLIGLLFFENPDQIDSLMIERRKKEKLKFQTYVTSQNNTKVIQ